MSDELERLIAEQAREMKQGSRVDREPIIALSLDAFDEQPDVRTLSKLALSTTCSKHGAREIAWVPSGWWWCRACHRQYARAKRRRAGMRARVSFATEEERREARLKRQRAYRLRKKSG